MKITVETSSNSTRIDSFISKKESDIVDVMRAVRTATYEDVKTQLEPVFNSTKPRHSKTPPGALQDAVNQSEASMPNPQYDGNIIYIGVGNIPILESIAKEWKFVEYGTYSYKESGGGKDEIVPPENSPYKNLMFPADKEKGKRGIAPNRAWRLGLYQAKQWTVVGLNDLFKKKKVSI